MFDRVTDRSQKILTLAEERALEFAHPAVHTGHVVLGMASEGDGVAAFVLRDCNIDIDAVEAHVAELSIDPNAAHRDMVALDSAAMHAARLLNHNYCGTEHLLLGVTILSSSAGNVALVASGASLSQLGQGVLTLLGHFDVQWQSVYLRIVSG